MEERSDSKLVRLMNCHEVAGVEEMLRTGGLRLRPGDDQPLFEWLDNGSFTLGEQLQVVNLLIPSCTTVPLSDALCHRANALIEVMERQHQVMSTIRDLTTDMQRLKEMSPAEGRKKSAEGTENGRLVRFSLTPLGEEKRLQLRNLIIWWLGRGMGDEADRDEWLRWFGVEEGEPAGRVRFLGKSASQLSFFLRALTGNLRYFLPKGDRYGGDVELAKGMYDTHAMLTADGADGGRPQIWKALSEAVCSADYKPYSSRYLANTRNKGDLPPTEAGPLLAQLQKMGVLVDGDVNRLPHPFAIMD